MLHRPSFEGDCSFLAATVPRLQGNERTGLNREVSSRASLGASPDMNGKETIEKYR